MNAINFLLLGSWQRGSEKGKIVDKGRVDLRRIHKNKILNVNRNVTVILKI